MARPTVTAFRLVPATSEPDLSQEPFPGLSLDLPDRPDQGGAPSLVDSPTRGRRAGNRLLSLVGGRAAVERGMATAEYAVGLIAACAFAFVLYKVITTGPAEGLLANVITVALSKLPG